MTEGIAVRETWIRRSPCIPYLVVLSLMHPNGPQVIFDRTAKVAMLIFFALRVAPSRVGIRSTGCRDRENPRTRVGERDGNRGWKHKGNPKRGTGKDLPPVLVPDPKPVPVPKPLLWLF